MNKLQLKPEYKNIYLWQGNIWKETE